MVRCYKDGTLKLFCEVNLPHFTSWQQLWRTITQCFQTKLHSSFCFYYILLKTFQLLSFISSFNYKDHNWRSQTIFILEISISLNVYMMGAYVNIDQLKPFELLVKSLSTIISTHSHLLVASGSNTIKKKTLNWTEAFDVAKEENVWKTFIKDYPLQQIQQF